MPYSTAKAANQTWEALLNAHAVILRELSTPQTWAELTMREYDVVYTLSKCEHPIRLKDLNDHVLLSQPALSRLVDRLVERGLVERYPDPDDRRGTLLCLTDQGKDAQRRTGSRHAIEVNQAVSGRLDADEMNQLADLCQKLAQAPRPSNRPDAPARLGAEENTADPKEA